MRKVSVLWSMRNLESFLMDTFFFESTLEFRFLVGHNTHTETYVHNLQRRGTPYGTAQGAPSLDAHLLCVLSRAPCISAVAAANMIRRPDRSHRHLAGRPTAVSSFPCVLSTCGATFADNSPLPLHQPRNGTCGRHPSS